MVRRIPFVLLAGALALGACGGGGAGRDSNGRIEKAGKVSVFDLEVGDCLLPGDKLGGEVGDIEAVPCAEPHTHEVYALPDFDKGGDVYPGEGKIKAFADAQCLEAFGQYTGADYLDSKLFFSYLQPSIKSWQDAKDRRIVCVIVATGAPTAGSAKAEVTGSTTTTAVTSTTSKSSTTTAPSSTLPG